MIQASLAPYPPTQVEKALTDRVHVLEQKEAEQQKSMENKMLKGTVELDPEEDLSRVRLLVTEPG